MARSSYADMSGLPDPVLSYNFDLLIPNLPGGGNSKALTIKCQSTSLPGMSLEDVTVAAHGIELKYAGRPIYTHTLSATFWETRDMTTRDALMANMLLARNAKANTGDYKVNYSTLGFILLYDDTGSNVIRTTQLEGFYTQDLQEVALDGATSTALQMQATFFFDLFTDL